MAGSFPAEVTPDLAPPKGSLRPEFPLALETTSLVLYPGAPEELRVRWSLRADDFVSYGAGFPADSSRPEAVLRLRRLCPWGGAETAHEIRLRLHGIGGDGDAGFRVDRDYAQFEAELGLINDDGGWLLLARSNRLQHATGIGLESLGSAAWAARRGDERRGASPPVSSGDACSALPVAAAPESVGPSSLESRGISESSAPRRELLRISEGRPSSEADTPGSPHAESAGRGEPMAAGDGAERIDGPLSGGNAKPAAFSAPTLVYGKPAPMMTPGLQIEAELHIRGWAPPNSEVDLFGHRYRVGPGGGFQLVLKVDDPDLLKRALASHPPSELSSQRDD